MCFLAFTTSSTPPIPIANAPVAKGLTSGVKADTVPVVPQRMLAITTNTTALKLDFT